MFGESPHQSAYSYTPFPDSNGVARRLIGDSTVFKSVHTAAIASIHHIAILREGIIYDIRFNL